MQIHNKLELLNKRIEDDAKHLVDAVSNGACKTIEEYKTMCGQIRAIRLTQGYIKELAQQEMDDD